jgi:RNA polymerase sigma factor (sigma-70 family)
MEAASAVSGLSARLREQRFERECERLRPLGEAYVLRHFAGSLGPSDGEDVVSEVLLRLHRRKAAGKEPDNLRAVFFTAVRNAAIDQLRSRSAKPTVSLEVAIEVPTSETAPPERAEVRDDALRLQEALARMRDNYRETILLRFGLGLTVPEIAAHFEISVAAAKKRVLRASAQVRKRLAAIEGHEFCPDARELARQGTFDKGASDLTSEAEAEALRAHFAHCGSCRTHLAALRRELHELGAGLLATLGAGQGLGGNLHLVGYLERISGVLTDAGQAATEKMRHLALRASGPFSSGDGAAGVAMGAGQKIVAVCGAGAAATATCLLSGAVGPGIGATSPAHHVTPPPAAKVKVLSSESSEAPAESVGEPAGAPPESPPSPGSSSDVRSGEAEKVAPPPLETSQPVTPQSVAPEPEASPPPSEFGINERSSSTDSTSPASPPEAPSSATKPSTGSGSPGFGSQGGAAKSSPASGGSVGFQG